MQTNHNRLLTEMMAYYGGDPQRIQHFIKVYTFAKMIGEQEGLDEKTQYILETAAIVHDIGIKKAEQLYGYNTGKMQEEYGPALAKEMLQRLRTELEATSEYYAENEQEMMERVCYLVGHHHTYQGVDGRDYRILLEADFIVNALEDKLPKENIQNAYERIFKTEAGKSILKTMYQIENDDKK